MDRNPETITRDYNVFFADVISCRAICKSGAEDRYGGVKVVDAYVFAVGHNDDYIVAKRHPNISCEFKVDTSITEFFIVDLKAFDKYEGGLYGPLNKIGFDSLSKSLNISSIKFDQTYHRQPYVLAR